MFRDAHPVRALSRQPDPMTAPAPGPAAPPTPSFVRPILALLAGLGITVVIVVIGTVLATVAMLHGADARSFVPSPGYLVAKLGIAVGGAIAGGLATARITAGRSFYTVFLLALVLFMSAIAPVVRGAPPQAGQPVWYPLVLAILGPVGVLVGGYLERRPRRGAPAR
jgi:hypothetical protein